MNIFNCYVIKNISMLNLISVGGNFVNSRQNVKFGFNVLAGFYEILFDGSFDFCVISLGKRTN